MSVYNEASDVQHPRQGHRLQDIPAHDPFILTDQQSGQYYLYTGGSPKCHGMDRYGVLTYKSNDLLQWEGPYVVFTVPEDSWAHPQHGAWAPEVHEYSGKYYLFVTLHNKERMLPGEPIQGYHKHWRSTVAAVSQSPQGPFELMNSKRPILPETLMILDGTLYIDEQNDPWMVYCHEWVQTLDGTIEAVRLNDDLSAAIGEPIHLFSGSEAPWLKSSQVNEQPSIHAVNTTSQAAADHDSQAEQVHHNQIHIVNSELTPTDPQVYVTDGCQLYRTSNNSLIMLWSSYEQDSYVQTMARSVNGTLEGPWEQLEPLVKEDSGHGMLFQTFNGEWLLILHRPFAMPESRCWLYRMEDTGDAFKVVSPF